MGMMGGTGGGWVSVGKAMLKYTSAKNKPHVTSPSSYLCTLISAHFPDAEIDIQPGLYDMWRDQQASNGWADQEE